MKLNKIIKYTIGAISTAILIAGTGNNSIVSVNANQQEQVFRMSQILGDGANDSIGNYWQSNGGLMPYLLYRTLLKFDPASGELKPDLAEYVEVSADELTYTIKLKDNLKWSDGEALTVEDVKFSIETVLKASLVNGIFPENFLKIEGAQEFQDGNADSIAGLNIESNNLITIKLKERTGLFTSILGQFFIFPKHELVSANPLEIHNDDFWKDPVSSGMYKVNEIVAGNYIELVKNENYEGEEPKIDKVINTFINDPVLAVQDAQSYYYVTGRLNEVETLDTVPFITKFDVDVLYYRYFVANLSGHKGEGNSIVADPLVREALMYAIDRETLASSLFKGTVLVNNTGVPTSYSEYDVSSNNYEYNPEKAKQMLEDANFDFSKTLKIIYYHSDQTTANFIAAVSQMLNQIGINVEATLISSDPTTALFQTRDYDLALKAFSSFSYESWYGEYSSNSTTFSAVYNNDTSFDELLQSLAGTSDEEERTKILKDLQALEQEKLHKLPLFTSQNYLYINTEKVEIPKDMKFSNPFYQFDLRFEEWEIK